MVATQQINLYLPELRPNREWLTAARLVTSVAAVIVVMTLISSWNYWERSSLQQELAVAQTDLAAQTARTEQIERDAASRQ